MLIEYQSRKLYRYVLVVGCFRQWKGRCLLDPGSTPGSEWHFYLIKNYSMVFVILNIDRLYNQHAD